MTPTVAVALLGLGIINDTHRRILGQLPNVRITAVWDPLPERSRTVAAEIGSHCHAYDDHRELLTQVPVDCAYIAVPPHRHSDHEILAARRGLPFLVEKPIVRHLGQARLIEAEICKSGVLHAVGYHNRYTPHARLARETLDGAVVGLTMGWTCWVNQVRGSQRPWHSWLFDDHQGGGQLHEHTTHVFDLARFFVGDVRRVFASRAQRLPHDIPGYNTADVNAVQLEFENGAIGQIVATHMTPTAYWWGINVLADRAIVEYNQRKLRVQVRERSEEYEPDAPLGGHYWEDAAFIEAVRTGNQSLIQSTYSDAIKTTAISIAALESAQRGEPVAIETVLQRSHEETAAYQVV
ncbi:MAG: Gfo/Idh/MocA family oxidoreductase [Chloroflexi bacterium]|nr:Gfo/Idh/MocA family oxidoreductase [Chloroflexota bacterium]